jgi:hypothetical protein
MKRTIVLKLQLSPSDKLKLAKLQATFVAACNATVPFVQENRCWNSVALHHFAYYQVREVCPHLGPRLLPIRNRGSRALFAACFVACVADITANIGIPYATRHRKKWPRLRFRAR